MLFAPVMSKKVAFKFGPFVVDPAERLLLRHGEAVPLTSKAFDTLLVLLNRHGHLVDKSELMRLVWDNAFVEEGNITVAVSTLRKALGDEGRSHSYIQTIAKRGYRFIGQVDEISEPEIAPQPIPLPQPLSNAAIPLEPSGGPQIPLAPLLIRSRRFPTSKVRIVALALGCFLLTVIWVQAHKTSAAKLQIRSIAVLPFGNLNSDPAPNHLGLGMADAIITRLGSNGQIVVRPTSAVMKYENLPTDPVAIGREQRVDAVLTGNIGAQLDRVSITAQLVRVSDGVLLWAERFDDRPQQLSELEREVEDRVARSMSVKLSGDTGAVHLQKDTPDPNAYQLYIEGRYFWNRRTDEGLRRSIEYFQRATMADQRYALAFAGLADSYTLLASYGVEPTKQAYPSAKAAALKALELEPSLAEAHTSLGMVAFYYEWNWPQAEREFQRSIELNPNYPLGHTWYALELAATGRLDESLSHIQRALHLDESSPSINTELGRVHYWRHEYDLAIAAYQQAIKLDPQFSRAHTRLGIAYAGQGHFSTAVREFKKARELSGPDPYLDGLIGFAQASSGNVNVARTLLHDLHERSKHEYVPAFSMAIICIGLKNRDEAFDWLAKAYQDRSTYMVWLKTDPLFDPLRSDPRFNPLMNRMGF
jgi:DNA-binding winged helix-turn-helix (wHTH) protein/TolB-like protein/tetratricopeptide (TPR) repeat protein